MSANLDEAHRLLEELFPIVGPLFELALVPGEDQRLISARPWQKGENLWLVARTIVYEMQGDARMIRDIREQEVCILPAEVLRDDLPRVCSFLTGMAAALGEVLSQAKVETLELLMPHELLQPCCSAFWLKRARSAADFQQAIGKRSRLGHLVPGR